MQSYSAASRSLKVKEMMLDESIAIKDIPFSKQGICPSAISQWLMDPFLLRMNWLMVGLLAIGCIPLLCLKVAMSCILFLKGDIPLKKLKKTFFALFACPITGILLSVGGMIPFSKIGKRWVIKKILPASKVYANYVKNTLLNADGSDELLKSASYYQLGAQRKLVIDSADFPYRCQTPFVRIHFCGNGSFYEIAYKRIIEEDRALKCNGRVFNYPGIKHKDEVESITDLINAGIIQVFHLAQLHHWTNKEVERYVHLYGRSLGGAIALQVALYFKEYFNLSLQVIVDRSFSSVRDVMGLRLNRMTGLPIFYGKWLSTHLLAAAGRWNADSIVALKKLEKNKVTYFNVAIPTKVDSVSLWEKLMYIMGITPVIDSDRDIPVGSSFAEGIVKINIRGSSGYWLYTDDWIHSHYVELSALSVNPNEFQDALKCYASLLQSCPCEFNPRGQFNNSIIKRNHA